MTRQRTIGVNHPPESDIETIRDLLRGYGSAPSILKELIQNAEDAGSQQLDVLYLPGLPDSPMPLLRLPALLVINDGTFEPKHAIAIRQIYLGTKGTDEKAIGRFGKGLKSVFAWCECFFMVARTKPASDWKTSPAPGWDQDRFTDLFNPWSGWRHQDWDENFFTHGDLNDSSWLFDTVASYADSLIASRPWLAFWFPLRQQDTTNDDFIANNFPGDEPDFFERRLVHELKELMPSLVNLHNLKQIQLQNWHDPSEAPADSYCFSFTEDSQHIPAHDTPAEIQAMTGQLGLRQTAADDADAQSYHYAGYAGHLKNPEFKQLKAEAGWPRSAVRQSNNSHRSSEPVNGEPHFSTLLSWRPLPEGAQGNLKSRWSVFFPVGEQPGSALNVPLRHLNHEIILNLHGFFFLDSDRLRIDGLEKGFQPSEASEQNKTCIAWNRILATQGTLAHLPQTLADYAQAAGLEHKACQELCERIRQSPLWQHFADAICAQKIWLPRWQAGALLWVCLDATTPLLHIPFSPAYQQVLSAFPQLAKISQKYVLITENQSGLYSLSQGHTAWTEALLLQLLKQPRKPRFTENNQRAALSWLNTFLNQLPEACFTPAVIAAIKAVPLIALQTLNANQTKYVTCLEYEGLLDNNQLFDGTHSSRLWFKDLSAALPEWTGFTADVSHLKWFERLFDTDMTPPACSERLAAKVLLQTETLGELTARYKLFQRFESQGLPLYQPERLKAMRYLMHACFEEADNLEALLYVSDAQDNQQIWSQMIEQLLKLEADEKSWVYLDDIWASELAPGWRKHLQVVSINATGVWEVLQKPDCPLSELTFSLEEWPAEKLSYLILELSRAAGNDASGLRHVLSRLCIHTLAAEPDVRIALFGANAEAADTIYLDSPDLNALVPEEVRGLWQSLRRQLVLVKRLAKNDLAYQVQEALFQTDNLQVLDWHHALKHILATDCPADFAPLILFMFDQVGSLAVKGVENPGERIKLPLITGEVAQPAQVIAIEKIDPMLQLMFKAKDSRLISILDLEAWIVQHPGFKTLQNHMPSERKRFELLADWLEQRPEWHLGFGPDSAPEDKHKLLMALQQVQDQLPAVELLRRFYEGDVSTERQDLVVKYLWPAVLKPFAPEQVYQRLEGLLASFNDSPQPLALNAYLKQYDADVLRHFLPRLRLQNMQGRWLPARDLIWPSHSVNVSVQLCKEQSRILQSKLLGQSTAAHALTPDASEKSKAAQLYDPVKAAKTLRQFIKRFQDSALVSDNVLAAFVAMLGDDPQIVSILNTLLKTDLRQTEEEFIAGLLGDRYAHYADLRARARFHFELVKQERARLPNLLGEKIHVALTDNIDTLIVGSTDETKWKTHWYGDAKDAYQIMRLRWIDNLSDLPDPVEVFAKTIALILTEIYARSSESIDVEHIREFVGGIADAGQMDLRRSQSFLLDMAEQRLQSLGLRTSPQIKAILDQFNQIREQRLNADMLKSRHDQKSQENKTKAERDLQVLNQKLKQMLESDAEMHQALVQAIQHKMTDYQYNLASVPFEIYQNADDACAEHLLLGEGPTDDAAARFVLTLDTAKQQLCFIHGGRPINYYGGNEQAKQRGFDKDLQKMLTLTFSDKGLDAEQSKNTTTGHFGLGFKSVFFVSSLPRVLSGRLAFEVRAGFYPVALKPEQIEALRKKAREFDIKDRQATVIELSWQDPQETDPIQKSIATFQQEADLMVIFSRQIKQIVTVVDQVQEVVRFQTLPLAAVAGLKVVHSNSSQYLVFGCSFQADQQQASLLFALDTHGLKKMPSGISNLWITTPTQERSDIGWVLNAPLKPDAGRQVLARKNPKNRDIARLMASQWGEQLVSLYDHQAADWSAFAKALALHDSATRFTWWKSFWAIVTQGKCVLAFEDLNHGGELLNWLVWGQSIGAVRHLYTSRPAIPNGFEGTLARLMHLDEIHFYLDDLLKTDNNLVFQHISQWPSFQKRYPLESIVKPAIADALMKQHLKDKSQLQEITLLDVLLNEIGKKKELSPDKAKRLAQLMQDCPLAFDADIYRDEVTRLYHDLSEKVTFKARSGNYRPASDLLIGQHYSDVEADEVWRSYFAPDDYCLHPDYTEAGVTLFRHVRQVLKSGDVKQMAQWVKNPDHLSAEQFKALLGYLYEGELAQKLADALGRRWFDEMTKKQNYASLTDEYMRRELKRKFRCYDQLPSHTPWAVEQARYELVMDPEDALRKVARWWKKQQSKEIQKQQNLYPFDFSAHLLWPNDPDWGSQAHRSWLLLFFHAALMPLGLNKLRRDQTFLHFLESSKWLTAFEQVSEQPTLLLQTLDTYLNQAVADLEHHFQMRQFIAFYAISKNIENFLDLFKQAEKEGDFATMFNPNANPKLIGSGVRIPPFNNILGIGTSFIIREMYRLGHFRHPKGHAYAYTPLRKVRILCQQIFGVKFERNAPAINASQSIFNALNQLKAGSSIDITFGHCFDLPLQILAENRELREYVLEDAHVEVPDTEDDWLDLLQAETEGSFV